jgi:hypothetical protein
MRLPKAKFLLPAVIDCRESIFINFEFDLFRKYLTKLKIASRPGEVVLWKAKKKISLK